MARGWVYFLTFVVEKINISNIFLKMNIIFLFVVDFLIAIGSFHGRLWLCSTAYTSQTNKKDGGHGGRVVTLWPPTSEAGVQFPAWPQVGKLVVACRWSAVYSTEPWCTVCTGFLCPSNYPSWYDLYSVESDVKPK